MEHVLVCIWQSPVISFEHFKGSPKVFLRIQQLAFSRQVIILVQTPPGFKDHPLEVIINSKIRYS